MLLLLGETNTTELPNLAAVMKEYGMEAADGYIADPQRCYQGNAFYIFPMLSLSGDMAKGMASEMVLLINAHGLNLTDPARDTISATSFMTTSNSGAAVTEETQTDGTYTLGAVATETVSGTGDSDSGNGDETAEDGGNADAQTKETRLTVISSANMIDSQLTETFTTLENTTLFMNAVTANFDGVENLSIEPKSLAVQYNTIQHVGLLSLFAIFGIPLVILAGGFTVWFKRRKA